MKTILISMVAMVIFFTIATPNTCYAANKSDAIPPTWIKNPPQGLNNTYSFKVVETDAGNDLSTARKHSQKELTRSVEREFNIKVSDVMESQSTTHYNNKKISYLGDETYTMRIESDDAAVNIYYERVDEYYRIESVGGNRVFKLYTLYAVARPSVALPNFDSFMKTDKYGARGLWRSMIVPGWGQFYKGSKVKGGLLLGGTVACAAGIIFTESQSSDYATKATQTYNVDHIRTYLNKSNNYETARNICIGGAAAIYVYNLIDAIVAPGAKRVKIIKKSSFVNNVAFSPVATSDMNGFAATYKF